ncbi:MAG: hypothetical protein ACLQMF_08015 [Rectinemataceae bacterium]
MTVLFGPGPLKFGAATSYVLLALALAFSVFGCSSIPTSHELESAKSVNIVSILNDYQPPQSNESFTHLSAAVRDFNAAARSIKIEGKKFSTVIGGGETCDDLVREITRFDSADSLTVAYIASHGSSEGLVLNDCTSFDDLYEMLEARSRGKILLILDSCYSGVFTDVLAYHKSTRIFAITGTKGPILERWYSKTGSFSEAVSKAIRGRAGLDYGDKLTLGRLYDVVAAEIRRWNLLYSHNSGPISDPDLYGPRDLIVFASNQAS